MTRAAPLPGRSLASSPLAAGLALSSARPVSRASQGQRVAGARIYSPAAASVGVRAQPWAGFERTRTWRLFRRPLKRAHSRRWPQIQPVGFKSADPPGVLPSDLRSLKLKASAPWQSAARMPRRGRHGSVWTDRVFASRVEDPASGLPLGRRCRSKGCDAPAVHRFSGATGPGQAGTPLILAGSIRQPRRSESGCRRQLTRRLSLGLSSSQSWRVLVAPALAEYEDVDTICQQHREPCCC